MTKRIWRLLKEPMPDGWNPAPGDPVLFELSGGKVGKVLSVFGDILRIEYHWGQRRKKTCERLVSECRPWNR